MLYRPGKSLKRHSKSSSLHSKKNFFAWGMRVFCEWRHKWRTFRPPWPTLPGPGHQPLGGSISQKFLLETRLQSESFDTLDQWSPTFLRSDPISTPKASSYDLFRYFFLPFLYNIQLAKKISISVWLQNWMKASACCCNCDVILTHNEIEVCNNQMKVSVKAAFLKRVSAIVTYCKEKKMMRLRVKRGGAE